MNPVNNGLDYPIIRNRNFATRPVGRMGFSSVPKPVGRMGLANDSFENFAAAKSCILKDCKTQACVSRCPKGSTCYDPAINYVQDPCKSTLGFSTNLSVKSSDWVRFTSVANSGILPSHSSDWVRMVGFATSLPAVSSDWVRPAPIPQMAQMAGKAGFSSSLPAQGTTWQGKGWA